MAHDRALFSISLLIQQLLLLLLLQQQPVTSAAGREVQAGATTPRNTHISTRPPTPPLIDVIVIGDSTAANYTALGPEGASLYPRAGWAMFLQDHFIPSAVAVRDLAYPGCSSMSFYREQLWQQAKDTFLSAGDYVLIQFGHNDQKADPLRHTDPFTTFKYYLSIYINDTRAAMATPVLVTPISRALWHTGGITFFGAQSLGDYPVAMRQLAEELHVPLIDLNEDTSALFTQLGRIATQTELFMCLPPGEYPNYPEGSLDTTHLQVAGAKRVAALAAAGVAKAALPIQAYLIN